MKKDDAYRARMRERKAKRDERPIAKIAAAMQRVTEDPGTRKERRAHRPMSAIEAASIVALVTAGLPLRMRRR